METVATIIGAAIAFLGVLSGAIWWASAVSTKLDYLVSSMKSMTTEVHAVKEKIDRLEDRVLVLEETRG